jgi:lysophospholipase L1-like esterase
MRARGHLLSCLVTMVIALAGFVTAGSLPAVATPSTIQYVALGDSYAAGTAAGSFPNCPHGPAGYPTLLDGAESRIVLPDQDNVTCSGETTSEVAEHQLSALDRDTRLVTLTVGAANLGLSAVAAACIGGTLRDCLAAIEPAQRELGDCPGGESTLGGRLTALYAHVADKARGARIVVTGYPLLFEPPANADPVLAAKITAINEATAKLNCVIERAVATTQATYANIHYADVTEEFAAHGIVIVTPPCTDPSAFIHSLLICDPARPPRADSESFHPTAAGYRAYADAISAALPGGWLNKPPRSS